jgi:hypothetical protein
MLKASIVKKKELQKKKTTFAIPHVLIVNLINVLYNIY